MRLVASIPVKNEMKRYLEPCIDHLLEFCDEIRVLDDGSTDGTIGHLRKIKKVKLRRNTGPSWSEHEGAFRQTLLDWTREGTPSHILAIDADEFVVDGKGLRRSIQRHRNKTTFTLNMREVWSLDPWKTREDGGWVGHPVGICFRCPSYWGRHGWGINQRKMAGGRVPRTVQSQQLRGKAYDTNIDILHLGWARPQERKARYERYATIDGGEFHAGEHIESIMWPDSKCELKPYESQIRL